MRISAVRSLARETSRSKLAFYFHTRQRCEILWWKCDLDAFKLTPWRSFSGLSEWAGSRMRSGHVWSGIVIMCEPIFSTDGTQRSETEEGVSFRSISDGISVGKPIEKVGEVWRKVRTWKSQSLTLKCPLRWKQESGELGENKEVCHNGDVRLWRFSLFTNELNKLKWSEKNIFIIKLVQFIANRKMIFKRRRSTEWRKCGSFLQSSLFMVGYGSRPSEPFSPAGGRKNE